VQGGARRGRADDAERGQEVQDDDGVRHPRHHPGHLHHQQQEPPRHPQERTQAGPAQQLHDRQGDARQDRRTRHQFSQVRRFFVSLIKSKENHRMGKEPKRPINIPSLY
jgi:hypothetical protein